MKNQYFGRHHPNRLLEIKGQEGSTDQNHEYLNVISRLLFTSKDGLEKNSPIKIREEIDTKPFQLIFDKDLEEIVQNSDSPIKHNNILGHRQLVYDGELT